MSDTTLAIAIVIVTTLIGGLIAGGLGAIICFFGALWFVNN